MFKNMGGNIPVGNFPGGKFPDTNLKPDNLSLTPPTIKKLMAFLDRSSTRSDCRRLDLEFHTYWSIRDFRNCCNVSSVAFTF